MFCSKRLSSLTYALEMKMKPYGKKILRSTYDGNLVAYRNSFLTCLLDIVEEFYNPRSACVNFVADLARLRGKTHLGPMMTFVAEVLLKYFSFCMFCLTIVGIQLTLMTLKLSVVRMELC
jgi:hypothetical protein